VESVESGSEGLSADLPGEVEDPTAGSPTAVGVEIGLSAFRCSNVANLLQVALGALAVGDVARTREAVEIALEILGVRRFGGG
jgi:hypothetical protein